MSACAICNGFGAEVSWEDQPRPAAFDRLEPHSGDRYRCPECGNQYELQDTSWSFLNADYDRETLRRLLPSEYATDAEKSEAWSRILSELGDGNEHVRETAALVLGRDLLKSPDRFDAMLLASDDETVRIAVLGVLYDNTPPFGPLDDIRQLEPRLRALLTDPSTAVRQRAAYLLVSHLLRSKRQPEAIAILDAADGPRLAGALDAANRNSRCLDFESLTPHLLQGLKVRDKNAHLQAATLLMFSLSDPSPRVRRLAASVLESAAEQGSRLSPGVVGSLIRALSDPEAGMPAARALRAAARRGMKVAATLADLASAIGCALYPGVAVSAFVRRLSTDRSLLAERRGKTLTLWLTVLAESDPLEALRCLDHLAGRVDLSAAAETLRRLASEADDPEVRSHAQRIAADLRPD